MRAGGVKERLNWEWKARVDGGMSKGGGFLRIGWSSHMFAIEVVNCRGCGVEVKLKMKLDRRRPSGGSNALTTLGQFCNGLERSDSRSNE